MIRDQIIIGVGSNWTAHPTSKHHVMRRLAECNDVIWVNYHASRRPRFNLIDLKLIAGRLLQAAGGAQRAESRIKVLSPLLAPLPEARWARRLNAWLVARQVKRALAALPPRDTQLWLFTPDAPELIDRIKPRRVIYYCVDDFAGFSGFNPELMTRLEQQTCAAADVVLATAERLHDKCRRLNANCQLLPHGVDFEHFAAAADLGMQHVPADVRDIPKPIFGYFGLISDYVDLDLLAAAARRRPDWSFVLLGDCCCDVSILSRLYNVHLLGGKPYEDLPRYCRAFDVGLIPFRMNRLTRAVNPIKLREYLAAGLPVVSAPMPEVLRYAPVVQTAVTVDEFIAACATSLAAARDGDAAARRALVREESWRARVDTIARLLADLDVEDRKENPADQPRPSQSRKSIKAMA